jgi:hypothetical protein
MECPARNDPAETALLRSELAGTKAGRDAALAEVWKFINERDAALAEVKRQAERVRRLEAENERLWREPVEENWKPQHSPPCERFCTGCDPNAGPSPRAIERRWTTLRAARAALEDGR